MPAVAWPTVFNAWVGGGDPGADCGTAWDFRGFQPVGPFIGSAWDADEFRVGRDLQLCLAGFDSEQPIELVVSRPDGSAVPLAIYRNSGVFNNGVADFEFLQELATVSTNAEGWAFHTFDVPELEALPTGKGTPQIIGPQYCIVSTPDLIDFDCQPGFTPTFDQP